ncbi:MAG: glycosyltransferase [Bacteroidetes bacterium]|nr:glycosyltransferase [Bacteroidota bacterium]
MPAKLVLSVYSHPEFYPPTLNAIQCLADDGFFISVVCRNVLKSEWTYPAGTKIYAAGSFTDIRQVEKKPFLWKIFSFFNYLWVFRKTIARSKPEWVVVYDEIPLFALSLIRWTLRPKFKVWYHNHDPLDLSGVSRFSVSAFAKRKEPQSFGFVDIFSLPAEERKGFFDLRAFTGSYFFIPNLPSLYFYGKASKKKSVAGKEIRLIYQGFINENKGIEEILSILNSDFSGKKLKLVLKGTIRTEFKARLNELAKKQGIEKQIEFIGFGNYEEVPVLTNSCHIGIGIHHSRQDMVGKTLGTASNKIYEYAASGLPVLVFDSSNFRTHLSRFNWVFFTDLTEENLTKQLFEIMKNYRVLSDSAYYSFKSELNFESVFSPISKILTGAKTDD